MLSSRVGLQFDTQYPSDCMSALNINPVSSAPLRHEVVADDLKMHRSKHAGWRIGAGRLSEVVQYPRQLPGNEVTEATVTM